MSRIDPTVHIAQLIRRQAEQRCETPKRRAAGRAGHPADDRTAARLGDVVARRVKAIDAGDPDRRRKAIRIFLESVLLAELGDALMNDAGFHLLVEQVHGQMAADPDLARAMHEAADQLLDAHNDR